MAGVAEDLGAGAELDDAVANHDGDVVADVFDHGDVVGDEEVCEAEGLLQLGEEGEDPGLHRNVEVGDAGEARRRDVTDCDDYRIAIGDERVPARTVIWAAGVQAPADRARRVMVVEPDLTVLI